MRVIELLVQTFGLLFLFGMVVAGIGVLVAAPAGLIAIAEQLIKRTPTVNFKHFWIIWSCLMVIGVTMFLWWLFTR
tara:strand:+ start:401 stop:628 length:228 start_codon:yes stop_codon:yes gene_type:complete